MERKEFRARKGFYRIEEGGWEYPEYRVTGPGLAGFRRKAKAGLKALSREEVHAYGEAVEAAIRAMHLKALIGGARAVAPVECASGCSSPDGAEIEKHLRARHLAALHSCPGHVASIAEYAAAMAEKRARAAKVIEAADRFATPADCSIPEFLKRAA